VKPFRFGVNVWSAASRAEWVDKARKNLLEKRAKRAGVSVSSYLLLAEDKFAHLGEK